MTFKSKLKQLQDASKKLENLHTDFIELESKNIILLNNINLALKELEDKKNAINRIIQEKSHGIPFLANAISEFNHYKDIELVNYLLKKKTPAKKTSEIVKEIKKEKRRLLRENKILLRYINLYEHLFPWLIDYQDTNIDFLLNEKIIEENSEDPALLYIPKGEYIGLSETERNQKALDRYRNSNNKDNIELGRMYERYIGYLYEKDGYDVEYIGIEKVLGDMGRDLICKKNGLTEIIQCKYWSLKKNKIIHENHINQLYGTTIKYYIENNKSIDKHNNLLLFKDILNSKNLRASLITSVNLSETAKEFAKALGIILKEKIPLQDYPMIKCNLIEKIYHLPFDQQYDRIKMKNNQYKYVYTVKEAEKFGCRRAYKWIANQ